MFLESSYHHLLDHVLRTTYHHVYDRNLNVNYDVLHEAFKSEYGKVAGDVLYKHACDHVDIDEFIVQFNYQTH